MGGRNIEALSGLKQEIAADLRAAGLSTIEQVREASDEQLLAISGIGKARLKAIRACLDNLALVEQMEEERRSAEAEERRSGGDGDAVTFRTQSAGLMVIGELCGYPERVTIRFVDGQYTTSEPAMIAALRMRYKLFRDVFEVVP